ncbi:MAG: class I SAM-dependent methyltransferase [Chitinophagaceae bacterium]
MKNNILYLLVALSLLSCNPYSQLGSKNKKIFIDYHNAELVLMKFFARNININETDTICDVASGIGTSIASMSVCFPKSIHYYAEDIAIKNLTKKNFDRTFKFYGLQPNTSNIEVVEGLKDKIPFASKSLNYITISDALHEFEFKEKMLNEIHSVLRDTGKFFILEPVSYDSLHIKNESCGFYYLKNRELNELISNANFKIIADTISKDTYIKDKTYFRAIILAKK